MAGRPRPPQLSPVEVRVTSVLHSVEVNIGQPHELSSATRPGNFTLELPVRIDFPESAVVCPVASGSLAPSDLGSSSLSEYRNVNVSLPVAASAKSTEPFDSAPLERWMKK